MIFGATYTTFLFLVSRFFSMKEKNEAFFSAHTEWFLESMKKHGEETALEMMRSVMSKSLRNAYGSGFQKGKTSEFVRLVGERDCSVGLRVDFPEVSENKLIYRFLDDPFPGLKGYIEPERLDATYIDFKVSYILGEGWGYKTTKHVWKGDDCTEYVIEKNPSGR